MQSQGEVRMLLDRVRESSRDRAEMVSSKVHTQLMAIADEKVVASERRGQILEREVCPFVDSISITCGGTCKLPLIWTPEMRPPLYSGHFARSQGWPD